MSMFQICLIGLGAALVCVVCVFGHRLVSELQFWNEKETEIADRLEKTEESLGGIASNLQKVSEVAVESIRLSHDAFKTSLQSAEVLVGSPEKISAAGLLAKSAVDLLSIASQQVQGSVALTRNLLELRSGTAEIHKTLDILNGRAVNDQLSIYPRKIEFVSSAGLSCDVPDYSFSHRSLSAKSERTKFSLVCEADDCKHSKDGVKTRFRSPIYALPKDRPVSFLAHWLVDPKTRVKADQFFEVLEGTGIIEKGGEAIRQIVEHDLASAVAVLGIKATIVVSPGVIPLYLTSVIVLRHAVENHLDTLVQNRRDEEATERVRKLFFSDRYGVKDIGGPSHLHFGEWIRHQQTQDGEQPFNIYGGLTRWLDPQTNQFAWLCPDCAYAQIATYRTGPSCL